MQYEDLWTIIAKGEWENLDQLSSQAQDALGFVELKATLGSSFMKSMGSIEKELAGALEAGSESGMLKATESFGSMFKAYAVS